MEEMKWIQGKPTQNGWYWVRFAEIEDVEVAYWINGSGATVRNVGVPLCWPEKMWHFGPITAPAFSSETAEVAHG